MGQGLCWVTAVSFTLVLAVISFYKGRNRSQIVNDFQSHVTCEWSRWNLIPTFLTLKSKQFVTALPPQPLKRGFLCSVS